MEIKETGIVATEVLRVMKRSLIRVYILLLIFILLFVISVIDSIYQRCRIIDILEKNGIVLEDYSYKD